jgi:hypothetical protein
VDRRADSFDFAEGGRDNLIVWLPALVGLGLLAALLLAVVALTPGGIGTLTGTDRRVSTGPPAGAGAPAGTGTSAGTGTPSSTGAQGSSPLVGTGQETASPAPRAPSASASADRSAVAKAPRTAPPADLTGRYRLVASFDTEFTGEVRISNGSSGARHWTVRLVFGDEVGAMRAHWIESAPRAALQRSGPAYVFTSTAPVAPRSAVVLRFQFNRSGQSANPVSCSTNGLTCAGLR